MIRIWHCFRDWLRVDFRLFWSSPRVLTHSRGFVTHGIRGLAKLDAKDLNSNQVISILN